MTEAAPASGTPHPAGAPRGVPPPASPVRPPVSAPAASADRSSTGLHPHTAAALCYAAAWLGGLVFLAFERQSRTVRFHAWQSVLALGGLFLLGGGLWALGILMVFVSTGAFRTLAWMSQIVWAVMAVTWLVMLGTAFTGKRIKLPIVGNRAERWSVLRGR